MMKGDPLLNLGLAIKGQGHLWPIFKRSPNFEKPCHFCESVGTVKIIFLSVHLSICASVTKLQLLPYVLNYL